MPSTQPGIQNALFCALPKKIQKLILQQSDTIDLKFGEILNETNQPLKFVYFPLTCFISLLTTLEESEQLEIGLIGNEGMLGTAHGFDVGFITMRSVVQGAGTSLRLTVVQLRDLLDDWPALKSLVLRYQFVLMEQLIISASCTYFHEIEPRLARWLLMSQDRAHSKSLRLTHEFLATMLGVRRSGITIAAGKLQEMELIHYSRGKIAILDRKGLEAMSCQCYEKINQVYVRGLKA